MTKSPEAFRTISEVAEALDLPAHVLRFWETRFSQIRPLKRRGGRRYYRPADVALLAGLRRLLHEDGLTIKGAQKILREKGVRHVMALGDPAYGAGSSAGESAAAPRRPARPAAPRPNGQADLFQTEPEARPAPRPAPGSAPARPETPRPRPAAARAESGARTRDGSASVAPARPPAGSADPDRPCAHSNGATPMTAQDAPPPAGHSAAETAERRNRRALRRILSELEALRRVMQQDPHP